MQWDMQAGSLAHWRTSLLGPKVLAPLCRLSMHSGTLCGATSPTFWCAPPSAAPCSGAESLPHPWLGCVDTPYMPSV